MFSLAGFDFVQVDCQHGVEAQRAVEAVRYPPLGKRSGGGPTGYLSYGSDYSACANDEVLLMVQIETAQAAEAAAEILSVEGVDGCMIGPGDLSRTMGIDLSTPADRERHAAVIREIRETCVRVGKLPGIATGGQGAEQCLKDGFLFVLAVGDYSFLANGASEVVQWLNGVRATG